METRLTLRPGMPGTKRLVARYGERLICVRYLYDEARNRRLKTVELVIEEDARLRKTQTRVSQEFFLAEKAQTELA